MKRIRNLRWVAMAEGISFLVLLLIAMPLKYYLGWPLGVKVVGWAHGLLFMMYIAAVFAAAKAMKWNWLSILIPLAASVIPLATFFLDRPLKARECELEGM
jgi:integral membrane protein